MIAAFSFFAGLFALEHFFVQSRLFDPLYSHYYVMVSTVSLCLSLFFYFRSVSFFITMPKWVYKPTLITFLILSLAALLGVPSRLIWGIDLYFDPKSFLEVDNYFINSYSSFIGMPQPYVSRVLTCSAVVSSFSALVLLRTVLKSSQDVFFIIGLIFTIASAFVENFFLSFTFDFFVPLIFLSNLFEAFRMNSLTLEEYFIETSEEPQEEEESQEKYQNSNLDEERLAKLSLKIKYLFEQEKIFKSPTLNSAQLAKKVGIPAYQLSQVINIGLDTSFFELLSSYRIEYVKHLLKQEDSADKNIIDMAYEAGFNSKSAFNTAFKRYTGMTPSQYQEEHLLPSG